MVTGELGDTGGMPARLEPGSRVAGYVLEERIGTGGMAVVFRARDAALGRETAVKVLAPALAGDAEFRARFEGESQAIAAVRSPHILPVYAAGESGGVLYIATQYVADGDLGELLRRAGGRLDPARAAALVSQVAQALDAAHAAGLVHRDVKPNNVLVETLPDGTEHAYLADFGLSKRPGAEGLTGSSVFIGTPDYTAPEQLASTAGASARTDQYALACVAFRMLSGTVPYPREDALATLYAHVHEPVPRLRQRRAGLPAALDAVLATAMAKDPAARYGSCGELAAALAAAAAPPAGDGAHDAGGKAGTAPASEPQPEQPQPPGDGDPPEVTGASPAAPRTAALRGPYQRRQLTPGQQAVSVLIGFVLSGIIIVVAFAVNGQSAHQPSFDSSPGNFGYGSGNSGFPDPLPAAPTPSLPSVSGKIVLPADAGAIAPSVTASAFSADGTMLATEVTDLFGDSDAIAIWDFASSSFVRSVTLPQSEDVLRGLAFSSDDHRLIAVTSSQGVYQWSVDSGPATVITAPVTGHDPRAGSLNVAVSADGSTIASLDAAGDGIDVRSAATGKLITELADPDHAHVLSAAEGQTSSSAVGLSANGKVASVADASGNVYLWDVPGRKVTRVIRYDVQSYGHAGLTQPPASLSAAGNVVLLARDAAGRSDILLSAATGAEVRPAGIYWAGDTGNGSGPPVFTLDGKVVAVNADGTAAGFWTAATGAYLGQVTLPDSGSSIAGVSPDGKQLITENSVDNGNGEASLVSSPY